MVRFSKFQNRFASTVSMRDGWRKWEWVKSDSGASIFSSMKLYADVCTVINRPLWPMFTQRKPCRMNIAHCEQTNRFNLARKTNSSIFQTSILWSIHFEANTPIQWQTNDVELQLELQTSKTPSMLKTNRKWSSGHITFLANSNIQIVIYSIIVSQTKRQTIWKSLININNSIIIVRS